MYANPIQYGYLLLVHSAKQDSVNREVEVFRVFRSVLLQGGMYQSALLIAIPL